MRAAFRTNNAQRRADVETILVYAVADLSFGHLGRRQAYPPLPIVWALRHWMRLVRKGL